MKLRTMTWFRRKPRNNGDLQMKVLTRDIRDEDMQNIETAEISNARNGQSRITSTVYRNVSFRV